MSQETNIIDQKFYISTVCNSLDAKTVNDILSLKSDAVKKTGVQIPESKNNNIVVFQGIVSQNYWIWDASRNKYKYDQTWWIFDDYNYNPLILWQHDQDYGGIGHAVQFWLDEEKNLNAMFYVDLDTLEPRHAKQIQNGYVKGISTGASTVEYMFEDNQTGERYTREDAEQKYGWENVFLALLWWANDFITLVITKAKMIENSMVTIGSNEKALAMQNSIGTSFEKIAEEYKNSKNGSKQAALSLNTTSMNTELKKDNTTDDPETPSDAAATPEAETSNAETGTDAGTDAGWESVAGAETGTEQNSVATQKSDVETLKNTIEKMKQDHESEIASLKSAHEKSLTDAINSKREEERKNLARVVTDGADKAKSDVKTPQDFKNKYIQNRA